MMSDQDRWELNQRREEQGMRPLSPPKNFRRGFSRVASIKSDQLFAWGGWTLQHNKRRKPIRQIKPVRKKLNHRSAAHPSGAMVWFSGVNSPSAWSEDAFNIGGRS